MKFKFQAKSPAGEVHAGKIEAASQEAAIAMLQKKELTLLSIEGEKPVSGVMKDLKRLWEGVNLRDLSVFFRQFATLVEAKVSIVSTLRAVGDQTENTYLQVVIQNMIDDVEDGMQLSEAMSKHPAAFQNLSVSMVKAGEVSGNLQRSVSYLAENTEKNYELNSRVKSAMFYPLFVISAAVIVAFVIFTFVLPKLTTIFKDLNVQIPWYTKLLMLIGDFMSSYWWAVLLGIFCILLGVYYYVSTEDGKREWDYLKMKIPIFGKLFQYIYVARFAENLGILLDGGIPIVKALTIISEVVNSSVYEGVILRAADEVKTGGVMSNVFARSDVFPPIVSQMIRIGEESGKISDVLKNIAKFYSQEVERTTKNLSTMLEPILIAALGAGVALIVFAVLVPIYFMTASM